MGASSTGIHVMVFILCLGGLIGVVKVTGAFESGLAALTKKTKGREFLLVFGVSVFMIFGGTMCGLEEEAVAFYPIFAPIFIALGYDSIVVVGAIFMAGSIGTTFSTVNPFSAVIASNAAGTVFTEGIAVRAFALVVGAIIRRSAVPALVRQEGAGRSEVQLLLRLTARIQRPVGA